TPASGNYVVGTPVTSNTFTIPAGGLASGTYTQTLSTVTVTNTFTDTNGVTVTNLTAFTNTLITVTSAGHGLNTNNQVYLAFTTGGALSGPYLVVGVPDTSRFTVTNAESVTRIGNCLIPTLAD